MAYYINTDQKLREIFAEHCNLSREQYEWIRGEFIYLVADIQDEELQAEVEQRMEKMGNVFDFLLGTKELALAEYTALHELANEVRDADPRIITNSGVKLE